MALTVARIGAGLSLVAAALGSVAGLVGANARADDPTTGAHCVQQVVVETGGDQAEPAPHCFDTYRATIDYLTGGRVLLSPVLTSEPDGTGGTPVDLQIADGLIANGVTVLSTEYKDSGFSGATYTFTWGDTCANVNVAWSSMPSGWDNVISSSRPGSGCNAIHYDNTGATPNNPPSGASLACPSPCSSMGSMNDKTSSMRWVHT